MRVIFNQVTGAMRHRWRVYFMIILVCYVLYFVEHFLLTSDISNCMVSDRESKRRDLLHDPNLQPFYEHLARRSAEKWQKGDNYKMELYRDPRWRSRKPRLKVLLLSYLNAGSTYVGDVIRQNKEIFYVYHPIVVLQNYIEEYRGELMYLYKKLQALRRKDLRVERRENLTSNINNTATMNQISTELITNYLNCNFTELAFSSLSNLPYFQEAQTLEFSNCIRSGSLVAFIKCLHLLYQACNETEVTLVNTAQLPVKTAESLLAQDTDLKIIYLYRDPRATLWGQFNGGLFKWGSVRRKAETFCNLLIKDLKVVKNISRTFPGRFVFVRYETMWDAPKNTFESLQEFLGFDRSDVENNISKVKMNTLCADCAGSDRNAWRSSIPYEGAGIIDMHCARAYLDMGYKPISGQQNLRNLNFSLEFSPNII